MERIKAAIEKAKKNQPGSGNSVHNNRHKTNELDGSLSEEHHEAIEYNKTQIVNLNQECLNNHRIVAFNKSNQNSVSFDLLRTQVLRLMKENNWRTLAITSPEPEAGKTVVSINLAMSISQQTDQTVMLVDFDLRRPKVMRYLGLDVDVSLNEVLENKNSVQDALINPNMPHLVILPVKAPVAKASEMLGSKKVKSLVNDLKNRYEDRIVIFDLPPILNLDDTLAVLPSIDCVLLVIGNGMSTHKDISESIQHLGDANLLGYVLNKAEEAAKGYYYAENK